MKYTQEKDDSQEMRNNLAKVMWNLINSNMVTTTMFLVLIVLDFAY
jgi:hypothetical protein